MEFSKILGFLTILKESIKLLPINWKFTAPIITLTLLIPSIIFVSFIRFWQIWTDKMTDSIMYPSTPDSDVNPILYMLKYLTPILAVEIAFLFIFLTISHLSGIATILISASSYNGEKLSFQDLLSSIKKKWRRPLTISFRVSCQSKKYSVIVWILTCSLIFMYPTPITISIAIILWMIIMVFQLYESVVRVVSVVVCVVEESYQGKEALDKAEQLVEGQRVHGFMINLFFNVMFVTVLLVCWMVLGDKGSMNLTIYGLVFVNFLSLMRIFMLVAHTVFHFWCKKQHGEDIEIVGDVQYTKLPATALGSDFQ